MDVIAQLLSLTNIFLCLAVVALVWLQRRGIELLALSAFKRDLSKYKLWTEFFIPAGPIGTAGLMMLIPGIPVMPMFAASLGAKLVFGIGLGLVAGFGYRLVKKNLLDRLGSGDEETPYEL